MINIGRRLTYLQFLRKIFKEAKVLKSVKEKLKCFRSFFQHIYCFDRTLFQSSGFSAANTSQMINISLNRGIDHFTFWKVARSNQAWLYKILQVSLDRSQTHYFLAVMQLSMKFLSTQFITTFFELVEQLLLTFGDLRFASIYYQDLELIFFTDRT